MTTKTPSLEQAKLYLSEGRKFLQDMQSGELEAKHYISSCERALRSAQSELRGLPEEQKYLPKTLSVIQKLDTLKKEVNSYVAECDRKNMSLPAGVLLSNN